MRIIYDNHFDDYTITTNSETTNYEASNLQLITLNETWRSTGLNNEWIKIDAGAGNTITVDSVAILEHNLTNAAMIEFQMNATDAWGGPSVDETLIWRSGIIVKYFSSSSYRFARFNITDAGNTDGYIELGRVFAGEYLQVDPSSLEEFPINNNRTDITVNTDTNTLYSRQGVGYRSFAYRFPRTAYSMISSLRTMWDEVGKYKPFVFMNYDTDYTQIEPAYVHITNDFIENWKGHLKIEYNLELRETK